MVWSQTDPQAQKHCRVSRLFLSPVAFTGEAYGNKDAEGNMNANQQKPRDRKGQVKLLLAYHQKSWKWKGRLTGSKTPRCVRLRPVILSLISAKQQRSIVLLVRSSDLQPAKKCMLPRTWPADITGYDGEYGMLWEVTSMTNVGCLCKRREFEERKNEYTLNQSPPPEIRQKVQESIQ